MAHEVLASKPESTFANLLLPSIPTSNQRSTKHIQKGAQLYNGSGGGEKVVIGQKDRDHEMHIRRNDTAFKVVRNANTSGLSESPIISQNKLPERQFNGLGGSHG